MYMNQQNQIHENPFLRHHSADAHRISFCKPTGEGGISLDGRMRSALDFITREELTNRTLWKKFVEQFREKSDTAKYGWKCEYWGKMMRGAAFVYSVEKNEELYAVLEETVRDLLTVQEPCGRFSTYTVDEEFHNWDMWGRKYILLGLECFYPLCRDEALKAEMVRAMTAHADYILDKVGSPAAKKLPIWKTSCVQGKFPIHGALNSLSILEPMVLLYRLTKEVRYLDFATYLVEEGARDCTNVFELALADERAPYEYTYTKAYEMMSCFEGLLEYALEIGSEKWLRAVKQFAYRLMATDITVLGSAGTTHEFFDHAAIQQSIPGDRTVGQETCVSVTWMKLCARMLILTGDTVFADCFEQTLYNAYLGALNTRRILNSDMVSGGLVSGLTLVPTVLPFDSYTPLHDGARGTGVGGSQQFSDGSYYGCCACIGSVGIGVAPHMVLMKTHNGLAVMLYEKGNYTSVTPTGNRIHISMDTAYPTDGKIRMTVTPESPETFTLCLRIPSWSTQSSLCVNGEAVDVTPGAVELTREWLAGDSITLTLDMRVEVLRPTQYERDVLRSKIIWRTCEMVPFEVRVTEDHLNRVALRRGPLMLAQDARFTEDYPQRLDLTDPKDGYINARIGQVDGCHALVKLDGGISLIDCASAGATWDNASRFSVWMPTSGILQE